MGVIVVDDILVDWWISRHNNTRRPEGRKRDGPPANGTRPHARPGYDGDHAPPGRLGPEHQSCSSWPRCLTWARVWVSFWACEANVYPARDSLLYEERIGRAISIGTDGRLDHGPC